MEQKGTKKWLLLLLILLGMLGVWIVYWQREEFGSIAAQGVTAEQTLDMQLHVEEAERQRVIKQEKDVYREMMTELYELARIDPLAVLPKIDSLVLSSEVSISHEDYMNVIRAALRRNPVGVADQMIDHYINCEELPDFISRALEEKPDWTKGLLTRGRLRAYTPWARDYDGAESDLQKVIELDADSPESALARVTLGNLWRIESVDLTKAGKHKEAEALVRKAISQVEAAVAISPNAAGYTVLADLYILTDRPDDALASAKKAIELDPDTQMLQDALRTERQDGENWRSYFNSLDAKWEDPGIWKRIIGTQMGPEFTEVVYIYRDVDLNKEITYKEILLSELKERYGDMPLSEYLMPERLGEIFDSQSDSGD